MHNSMLKPERLHEIQTFLSLVISVRVSRAYETYSTAQRDEDVFILDSMGDI